jgi:hypothetical protein
VGPCRAGTVADEAAKAAVGRWAVRDKYDVNPKGRPMTADEIEEYALEAAVEALRKLRPDELFPSRTRLEARAVVSAYLEAFDSPTQEGE